MKLIKEFQPIRDWAKSKGIFESGDIKSQTLKLMEEVGELSNAVLMQDKREVEDAIGDCVVVLTSIVHFNGLSIEACVNLAYEVIAKRSGSMHNGNFVKS